MHIPAMSLLVNVLLYPFLLKLIRMLNNTVDLKKNTNFTNVKSVNSSIRTNVITTSPRRSPNSNCSHFIEMIAEQILFLFV